MVVMKGAAVEMTAMRSMIADEDIGMMTETMIEETVITTEGGVKEMMTMMTVTDTTIEVIDLIVGTKSDVPIDIDELLMNPLTTQNTVIKKTELQNGIPVHDVAALHHHPPHQVHLSLHHVTVAVIGHLPLFAAVVEIYPRHLPKKLIAISLPIAAQRRLSLVSSL